MVTFEQYKEIVLEMCLPFKPMVVIFVSYLESDPNFCSTIATILPFSLAFSLFGFNSRRSCQQWSSSWPIFERFLHVNFSFFFGFQFFWLQLYVKLPTLVFIMAILQTMFTCDFLFLSFDKAISLSSSIKLSISFTLIITFLIYVLFPSCF